MRLWSTGKLCKIPLPWKTANEKEDVAYLKDNAPFPGGKTIKSLSKKKKSPCKGSYSTPYKGRHVKQIAGGEGFQL